MSLARKQHWATRDFHDFLKGSQGTAFVWGQHDCCLFAANAIEAQTGVDIASDFRGAYSDKLSAFALIRKLTGGLTVADAAAYCADKHGLRELQHPLMCQRGDLVVFKNADGELVAGVVHLSGRHLVSVGESGNVKVDVTNVVRSWSIGGHAHPQAFAEVKP